jgi:hypothetical protein
MERYTALSGDQIRDGVVDNDKISPSAGIAFSKLAVLTSGYLVVGSGTNVPTATQVTGDVTIGNTGVTAIAANVIIDNDIKSDAAIAFSKLAALTSGYLVVGNATNVPTATLVTGDVTISNTGVTAITGSCIVDGDVSGSAAIAGTKISPNFGAQNIITTGTGIVGGATIDGSAVLQADSTAKGLLPPRMTQVQRLAISTPATGLLVFDTTNDKVYVNKSGGWAEVGGGGGHVIQDEGSPLTQRPTMNFKGDAALVTDNSGTNATDVTISTSRLYREYYVVGTPKDNYTGSTTVFDLVADYATDGKQMAVYVNGAIKEVGATSIDYVETDANTITFNSVLIAGDVVQFVWLNAVSTIVTPSAGTFRREDQTALGSPETFTLANTYTMGSKNLRVYVRGALQIPGVNYTEASSSTVDFPAGTTVAGDPVTFEWITDVQNLVSYTPATEVRENYAATGVAVYDLVNTYATGGANLKVYVDGVLMTIADDYTETTNQRVTFVAGAIPSVGQKVSFSWIKQTGELGTTHERRNEFVSTAGQTVYNTSFTFPLGGESLMVFNDGVLMKYGDDYNETSGSSITFVNGRASGSKVACVARMRASAGDADTVDGVHANYLLDQMALTILASML